MKNSLTCVFLLLLFTSAHAAELTPLLPADSVWSVSHAFPGREWATMYPLPKDRKVQGALHTDTNWPKEMKSVWMTAELELPEDYKPGNLFARYVHDDHVQIYINGTLVVQRFTWGGSGWGIQTFTKRVTNLLKPGKNVIAAYCENTGGDGQLSLALFTDDEPRLEARSLFPPQSRWSSVNDNPGEGWTIRCPLPEGKLVFAPVSSYDGGGWPWEKPNLWMTRIVELPEDVKPGRLHAECLCDDEMWVFINGEEVTHCGYAPNWVFQENIKNPLKPGKNIVAVHCANYEKEGYVGLDMYLEEAAGE